MSSEMPDATATATSHWCYSCSRFVRVGPGDPISCPDCNGGFLEEISNTPPAVADAERSRSTNSAGGDESFPAPIPLNLRSRRTRHPSLGHRSPFNPVIVLRGSVAGGDAPAVAPRSNDGSSFEFFYDDGAGTGLRPLPQSMSDFLMGSGFDRLLDQLHQIESNPVGGGRACENSPASKAAIESLASITITSGHIASDSCCAVCKEAFELGGEAREMPCGHIFHEDCILPWLSLRNSCPVCRHQLPADAGTGGGDAAGQVLTGGSVGQENPAGLTIWRLPGGGFAVGRFSGVRQAGNRELPVVYTEMDGSFSSGGAPRRISWSSRGSRSRERRGISRMFHNFFSVFRCLGPSPPSLSSSSRFGLPSASAELQS